MKNLFAVLTLAFATGCSDASSFDSASIEPTDDELMAVGEFETPDVDDDIDRHVQGLKSLYMGHSYFRRQADAMEEYAEIAGIVGHRTTSVFHGWLQRVSRRHLARRRAWLARHHQRASR